ncbi:nitrogenase component 1 [Agrilactobacillus yilanensis]|uniref:Nitrogenase component 1 n=1 Tax=Agrilactobacillus yilanensis TaxID=2485997 RepID=A0ABW4J6U8_9LACO|nr:nitrogenase component 1 [Agrilactobacillus yilanensis]
MLKPLGHTAMPTSPAVTLKSAQFPQPFADGLSYSVLSCGGWPLVQTGLLLPEAHLIFVCPQNCLRGVVLVAAEMKLSQRFSTVAVREQDVISGDMERLTIDGVGEIIDHLAEKPPAVLVFTNCIHHFVGTDLEVVYQTLRQRYPEIQFTDCYMNPIMRKSGLNPEQMMRRQLYSLLTPRPKVARQVNIIGNRFPMDPHNDLYQLLQHHGYTVKEVPRCETYAQYQTLAASSLNITTLPMAQSAGTLLADKLEQPHLFLPLTFCYETITENLKRLSDALDLPREDPAPAIAACEAALKAAKKVIGATPIAISFSACVYPLSLARLLIEHGFNVTKIFADSFIPTEKADFLALQKLAPNLQLYPTSQVQMRVLPKESSGKTLAIGTEAAYFTGTRYFVNLIEGAGLYGFDGIVHLMALLQTAFLEPKAPELLNQINQRGCECLL